MGILWKNWVASLTALTTPDALDVVPVVDVSVDATKKSSMGDVATSNAFTSQFASGVRPESYGAVGDGVTDDSTAIQAAIDAANGFRPVVFASPLGYYSSATLTVPQFGSLVGLHRQSGVGGSAGPRIKFPSGVGTGISLGNNCDISNLTIYGGGNGVGVSSAAGSPNLTNTNVTTWGTGAEFTNAYYSRLIGTEFAYCTTGLRIHTAYNFNLFGPVFRACATGIQVATGPAQSLSIFGGSIEGYDSAGGISILAAAAASHINLYGTYFETNTDNSVGIEASAMSASGQINLSGCRVYLNYQTAWLQMGTSPGSVSAHDNVFSCALVGTPTPIGLDLDGVTGTVTLGNNQAGGSGLLKGSITNRLTSGQPNGSLIGRVGDRYVDPAATAGARVWYKESGAGTNTGWLVESGDTGRQYLARWTSGGVVTGTLPAGLLPITGTAGFVSVRRQNNEVTVEWQGCKIGTVFPADHITFPVGFRPTANVVGVYGASRSVVSIAGATISTRTISPQGSSGNLWSISGPGVGDQIVGELGVYCAEAWPATNIGV